MRLNQDKHCTKLDFEPYKEIQKIMVPSQQPVIREWQYQPEGMTAFEIPTPEKQIPSDIKGNSKKKISGAPKELALVQLSGQKKTSRELVVRKESPWYTYRRTMRCKLAGDVSIASRRNGPSQVIAIREYTKKNSARMLEYYTKFDHTNILSAQSFYEEGDSMYALVDDLPLTLGHLVGCRFLYPTETELALMIWQILNGLCYLSQLGFEHQSLSCQNILWGLDGVIKIASLESCVKSSSSQRQSQHVKTLGSITMELMQKYVKDDGIIGVDDLKRWPVESHAFGFLSAISATNSIESLKTDSFMKVYRHSLGELVLLARTVLLSAKIFYSYET
ncbi:uncharacterized protein N7484_006093 [Penicillium longicatenatum]|uniref:uncharacterized protein n=1 Tax=Penicillium longicatenatum TaxID=1561947 RepID=UPI00254677C1|nr:uncharacterized protein N7484_006093 [Penicillium longicatenatum]KAJ5643586.1 hypothetical protein N7484_006093 [Penicillium longicatenatum]